MNTIYKYRTTVGVVEYKIINGQFGVDSTLHLQDTTCNHPGSACEIEVKMSEDGISYEFSQALNSSAELYKYFHTDEKFWQTKKEAFIDGMERAIRWNRKTIEDEEKQIVKNQASLAGKTLKDVNYLTTAMIDMVKNCYIYDAGVCDIIGKIQFNDGSEGWLTDSTFDDDRIILVEHESKNGRIVTESGDLVYLTRLDYYNHKSNLEIKKIEKMLDNSKKHIGSCIERIERLQHSISIKDTLTVEQMMEMQSNKK